MAKPGAYFCTVLVALLGERGVSVPVGSRQEREEVRGLIATSLGEEPASPNGVS